MAKLPKITSLPFLCNIVRKKQVIQLIFLHAVEHEGFLQISTMVLIGMVKHSQSSQIRKFPMSLHYKDKLEMKLIFCMQINTKVDFNTLGIKVSYIVILPLLMSMIKYSQSTQSNKFAITLQCVKVEVRDRVHFLHADKHQSFYKLALSFLIEMARHVQSTQNR